MYPRGCTLVASLLLVVLARDEFAAASRTVFAKNPPFCLTACEPAGRDASETCFPLCETTKCPPGWVCDDSSATATTPHPCPMGRYAPEPVASVQDCLCFEGGWPRTGLPDKVEKDFCNIDGLRLCHHRRTLTAPVCPQNRVCPPTKCEIDWARGIQYDPFAPQNLGCYTRNGTQRDDVSVPGIDDVFFNVFSFLGLADNSFVEVSGVTVHLLPGTRRKYVNGLHMMLTQYTEGMEARVFAQRLLAHTTDIAELEAVVEGDGVIHVELARPYPAWQVVMLAESAGWRDQIFPIRKVEASIVLTADLCEGCPVQFYCPSRDVRMPCPTGSATWEPGATHVSSCMCKRGYMRADSGACERCEKGWFCSGEYIGTAGISQDKWRCEHNCTGTGEVSMCSESADAPCLNVGSAVGTGFMERGGAWRGDVFGVFLSDFMSLEEEGAYVGAISSKFSEPAVELVYVSSDGTGLVDAQNASEGGAQRRRRVLADAGILAEVRIPVDRVSGQARVRTREDLQEMVELLTRPLANGGRAVLDTEGVLLAASSIADVTTPDGGGSGAKSDTSDGDGGSKLVVPVVLGVLAGVLVFAGGGYYWWWSMQASPPTTAESLPMQQQQYAPYCMHPHSVLRGGYHYSPVPSYARQVAQTHGGGRFY